jgi:hypothetical protein
MKHGMLQDDPSIDCQSAEVPVSLVMNVEKATGMACMKEELTEARGEVTQTPSLA